MGDDQGGGVLLTVADVRRWIAERDDLVGQIARLSAERDLLERRLELVQTILPPSAKEALFGSGAAEGEKPEQSTAWVRTFLEAAEGPIGYRDIIRAASESEGLGLRVQRNANVIYNAISRLADRGIAKKIGKNVVATTVYDRLKAQGRDPDTEFTGDVDATAPSIVHHLLTGRSDGTSAKEIISHLREDTTFGPIIKRNPQYGYTVLSRMAKRGELVRVEDGYKLPGPDGKEGGDVLQENPFE